MKIKEMNSDFRTHKLQPKIQEIRPVVQKK